MKSMEKQTVNRRRDGAISIGITALAAAILVTAPLLRADDSAPQARAERLSYVDGQVRVLQGDQVITENATVNTPIFEGMQVQTQQDGRAKIQFEDGSVARLSPDTTLTLSALRGEGSSSVTEMVVNGGLAYFELQGGTQSGQMTVRFADSAVTPSGNTVFRVRMDAPPGQLAVFSGDADLTRGNGGLQLAMHGGESVTLYANDISRYDLNESIDPDSWDAWNSDRDDAATTESASATGAGPTVGGSESNNPAWSDLDANGSWYNVSGTGYIWSPFSASNPGWDPYGCGQWMWYPRYGYIWVPCDQWGWMPSSCGSWSYYDSFGWGWEPGIGGCNPWWNSYGYYPGPRFGRTPVGFRPPRRPISPGRPVRGHPVPVIVVNRTAPNHGEPLPSRERNAPVLIAGKTVTPLQPVSSNPGFVHSPGNIAKPGYTIFDGSPHPEQGSTSIRQAYTAHTYPGAAPQPAPGISGGRYVPAPAPSRGAAPAPAPHPTNSSGGYHPSSGGGGGSSYHASSGGGGSGGGGGGSHVSSGGGGGGTHK